MDRKTIAYIVGAIFVIGAFGWFFYYVFWGTAVRFSPGGGIGSRAWWVIWILAVMGIVLISLKHLRKKFN